MRLDPGSYRMSTFYDILPDKMLLRRITPVLKTGHNLPIAGNIVEIYRWSTSSY